MANGSDTAGWVLVTGSNGKTGSRIVERLRAGGNEVRLGSRSATPLTRFHLHHRQLPLGQSA